MTEDAKIVFEILDQLGNDLAELRMYSAEASIRLDDLKEKLVAREIEITPEGGWPGSNAEARKNAASALCARDPKASSMARAIRRLEKIVRRSNAQIIGMEDRRRGLEYTAQAILKGMPLNEKEC